MGGSPLHRRNRKIAANLSTLTQMAILFSALSQERRKRELDREGDARSRKGGYSLAIAEKCKLSAEWAGKNSGAEAPQCSLKMSY